MSIGMTPSTTGSRAFTAGSATGSMKNKIPRGYEMGQFQKFTPEMMDLWKQMFGQLGPDSYIGRLAGGDEQLFNELEAPALRQFSGLQGNIASRFSGGGGGPGAMSSRRSSGFQNTMGQASSDFAQALQGQRMGLRNQALRDLMNMSNQLLDKNPYEQFMVKKEKPWWQQMLMGINDRGQDLAMQFGKMALMGA